MALWGPLKGPKIKISKKKKCVFDSCPKDYYAKKLGSQVKNCDLQVKNKNDKNQYKGKEENTRQKKRGGPSKGPKSKFRKNKKPIFYCRPKDYCAKKLGSQVKNCGLQVCGQTDCRTDNLTTEGHYVAFSYLAYTNLSPSNIVKAHWLFASYFMAWLQVHWVQSPLGTKSVRYKKVRQVHF